jgi:hypothetical protein
VTAEENIFFAPVDKLNPTCVSSAKRRMHATRPTSGHVTEVKMWPRSLEGARACTSSGIRVTLVCSLSVLHHIVNEKSQSDVFYIFNNVGRPRKSTPLSGGRSIIQSLHSRNVRRTVLTCEHYCQARRPVRENRTYSLFSDTTPDSTPNRFPDIFV